MITIDRTRKTLALSLMKNMGPVTFKNLLERFKTVEDILGATRNHFQSVKGAGRLSYADMTKKFFFNKADQELKRAEKNNIKIITCFDDNYPRNLKNIYDPPIVLYIKGRMSGFESFAVAVVGSRNASQYGRRMAKTISAHLAQAGVVVVSGLALGIDTAAHEGALAGGGVTYAVLGGGLSQIYPNDNTSLAGKISETGALISEYPPLMMPRPQYFPVRNRIISGLSSAVCVVEAGKKSGALITSDVALEQGRDVFALPGNADSSYSEGTNDLLRQGARLVTSAQDILEELNIKPRRKKQIDGAGENKSSLSLSIKGLEPDAQRLIRLMDKDECITADELIEKTGLNTGRAMALLSILEIKKLIKSRPGKSFVRCT